MISSKSSAFVTSVPQRLTSISGSAPRTTFRRPVPQRPGSVMTATGLGQTAQVFVPQALHNEYAGDLDLSMNTQL